MRGVDQQLFWVHKSPYLPVFLFLELNMSKCMDWGPRLYSEEILLGIHFGPH